MIGVKLPRADVQRLAQLARRRGVSMSAVVRELILQELTAAQATGPP
jgi:hypothetical protein